MSQNVEKQIAELEARINELPRGSVSSKTVNGHEYYYHRWYEAKRKVEKYIAAEEVQALKDRIAQRKALEKQLRELKKQLPKVSKKKDQDTHEYRTMVRRGSALRAYAKPVKDYKHRECYAQLRSFVFGEQQDKVFILYGLRRTGKTTMIRQILLEMDDAMLDQSAFIQITAKNTLADVNKDLRALEQRGCRYVFLDEVTLMEDFIDGAAMLSDVFAASGMKIVLSGTDSLGFLFTEDEQLYDRCIMLHTTFVPYRDFARVLGIHGIDEYMRYGGTMSMGGVHYNEDSTFASKKSADMYVDSAIARNIQHSLRCYQQAGHFRGLQELYEKGELTSAINRVVEDQTHRFTEEVLTRDFKSNDLSLSARNLRRDRERQNDILDRIDTEAVTQRLRKLLDLTQTVDVVSLPSGEKTTRTLIAQPGLRYAQAKALIESLLLDPEFQDLSIDERNAVQDRILSEILGRMMEDVVLLETKLANPKKQVFVIQFAVGEFDMVVADPETSTCEIYEIKHSTEAVEEQTRHLRDEEKCRLTEHRFGKIKGKYVIYRGSELTAGEVQYLNVERCFG